MTKTTIFCVLGFAICAILFTAVTKMDNNYQKLKAEFSTVYNEKVWKYADKDNNGFLTTAEVDDFETKLFQGKDVKYISGKWPLYKNGKPVPTSVVVKWLKDYNE